jgi:ribosomal-protein-alanine N-acetyltransferase
VLPLTREAARAHLPRLLEVDQDTIGEPWSAEQWLADLPGKWELSRLLVADGGVDGFVVASRKGSAAHVHRMAVAATARGQGAGGELLRELARTAAATGQQAVTLKVHVTNAPARRFYERLGFVEDGRAGDNYLMSAPCERILAAAPLPVPARPSGRPGAG